MVRKTIIPLSIFLLAAVAIGACGQSDKGGTNLDRGVAWVRTAAEFEALSYQAYRAASEDLQRFIDDISWSALPWQENAAELPPAIITDVDETMVSNVEFQVILEPPFRNSVMNSWNDATVAKAIPGAVDFIRQAQDAGVEVFFVTNRPCEPIPGIADPCPQQAVTLQDLREAGIKTDNEHLMLANEELGWDREKLSRRQLIARTHRVIMLLGDDLADFIPCSRREPLHPCSQVATIESRQLATTANRHYWGEGWYILPNPMHGTWTTVN